MPSVSKKQQKFMGIVRSIQKGEQPASKFSKDAQDAAKKMKKSSVKKYAKTKHDDLPIKKESLSKSQIKKMRDEFDKTGELPPHLKKISKAKKEFEKKFKVKDVEIPGLEWMSKLGEAADRDYKAEYKKFQSSTKAKKYRAELNKYNRQKGTYGNGDGKDASHKGGKIVGFEKESTNRGRAEKSRLKKEDAQQEIDEYLDNILEDLCLCEACQKGYMTHPTRKTKTMFGKRYRNCVKKESVNEQSKTIKKIEKLAKANKYGDIDGTKMNGKTANLIMKIYNHPKMKSYKKKFDTYKSHELVDMTINMSKILKIKEADLGLTYKRGKTVKVKHKKSGKTLVIVDKPVVRKEYEKIGYFAESVNEKVDSEMKKIYQLLIKYGNNAKDAAAMIKKNLKYVNKTYRNSTPRAKAVALVGLQSLGEGTCGYGIDGKIGEEPAGPNLIKKIKKISKSKIKDEKIKLKSKSGMGTISHVGMPKASKGVEKLFKIADSGYGKVGGVTVDSMSANLFKQIYNKANDDIKKKLNTKNEKQLVKILGGMWKKFGKNVSIGSSL